MNQFTRLVRMHIDNDQNLQEKVLHAAKNVVEKEAYKERYDSATLCVLGEDRAAAYTLAERLADYFKGTAPVMRISHRREPDSLVADLINHALREVEWLTLAEKYLSEYDEILED